MRGGAIAEKGVTGVAGVTGPIGLRLKPPQLRQLRPLRHEYGNGEKRAREGVSPPVTQPIGADFDAIEERAAIISETCPAPYADTFARLNHQKPMAVTDAQWSRALDDAGWFLDDWGTLAAEMPWSAGELFDVPYERRPGGLVWQLKGDRVDALGADHVRLSDGRVIAPGGVQRDETKIGE
ncbi:MAG: hypothetical protein WAV18_08525 [Roseiarcus sp.]